MKRLTQLMLLMVCASSFSFQADEVVFKKDYAAWGQGPTTNQAAAKATEAARPRVAELRAECDKAGGILTTPSKYGLCTSHKEPMFCKYGCYVCPVYGTATCTIDTTAEIKIGVVVEVTVDSDLFTGTTKIGKVAKGEKYRVVQISNRTWVSLEKLEGGVVKGWIRIENLKKTTVFLN